MSQGGFMPIYEWKCLNCGVIKEVLSPETPSICKCGGKSWKKLPVAPNFKVIDGTPKFYNK